MRSPHEIMREREEKERSFNNNGRMYENARNV